MNWIWLSTVGSRTPAWIISKFILLWLFFIAHTRLIFPNSHHFFFLPPSSCRRFVLKVGHQNWNDTKRKQTSGHICQDVTRRLPPPTETPRRPTRTPLVLRTLPTAAEKTLKTSSTNFLPNLPAAMTHSWSFHRAHLHKGAKCYRGTARGEPTDEHKALPDSSTKED